MRTIIDGRHHKATVVKGQQRHGRKAADEPVKKPAVTDSGNVAGTDKYVENGMIGTGAVDFPRETKKEIAALMIL